MRSARFVGLTPAVLELNEAEPLVLADDLVPGRNSLWCFGRRVRGVGLFHRLLLLLVGRASPRFAFWHLPHGATRLVGLVRPLASLPVGEGVGRCGWCGDGGGCSGADTWAVVIGAKPFEYFSGAGGESAVTSGK
jgi:hypothetical protein